MKNFAPIAAVGLIVALIALIVAMAAYSLWWEYQNPCLEYEYRDTICHSSYCNHRYPNGYCVSRSYHSYPCVESVCIRRGVRP